MENFDFRHFSPGQTSDAVSNGVEYRDISSAKRITPQQFVSAAAATEELSADAAGLIEKELIRQLSQVEPIYKLIHGLRVYVSQCLLQNMRDYKPAEMGFHIQGGNTPRVSELITKVEQTVKLLNVLFEDMQGMATEITAGIRRMSLGMQTQLAGFVFKLKDYSQNGEIDRSLIGAYNEDLMRLQIILGDQEVALEMTRGKIS